jgi:hypothetical protein
VTIDVVSEQAARVSHVFYAGEHDGEAPFEITIQAGLQQLLVVVLGEAPAGLTQKVFVVEQGAEDCQLRMFKWSTKRFSIALDVEGV